jgi:hypothetical protein
MIIGCFAGLLDKMSQKPLFFENNNRIRSIYIKIGSFFFGDVTKAFSQKLQYSNDNKGNKRSEPYTVNDSLDYPHNIIGKFICIKKQYQWRLIYKRIRDSIHPLQKACKIKTLNRGTNIVDGNSDNFTKCVHSPDSSTEENQNQPNAKRELNHISLIVDKKKKPMLPLLPLNQSRESFHFIDTQFH